MVSVGSTLRAPTRLYSTRITHPRMHRGVAAGKILHCNMPLEHEEVVSAPLRSPRSGALHFTRELIAERLARPTRPPEPLDLHAITLGEGIRIVHAAVLVPLVCHPDAIRILLTQRTEHLDDHASQISFPGGRVEPSDV